ncbi:MAG: CidA/LrgA family protein [Clostridiales bacterium]|nr:CidA/LrgA family protein [Clostridiales bacterium]
MQSISQLAIILVFSCLGELCAAVLPFQLPAAIYGLILLVFALLTKIVKLERVQDTGAFLSGLLPLLFIVPVVGLLDCWDSIAGDIGAVGIIILVSSVLVFAVSGIVTQKIIDWRRRQHDRDLGK